MTDLFDPFQNAVLDRFLKEGRTIFVSKTPVAVKQKGLIQEVRLLLTYCQNFTGFSLSKVFRNGINKILDGYEPINDLEYE